MVACSIISAICCAEGTRDAFTASFGLGLCQTTWAGDVFLRVVAPGLAALAGPLLATAASFVETTVVLFVGREVLGLVRFVFLVATPSAEPRSAFSSTPVRG